VNRREALRRLAATGAIAVGGSQVLSTTAVAQTASGPLPVGIPSNGESLPVSASQETLFGLVFALTLTAPTYSCDSGSLTTTYAWKIDSYAFTPPFVFPGDRYARLESGGVVIDGGPGTSCGPNCTGAAYATTPSGSATITRRREGLFGRVPEAFSASDTGVIDLLVTWTCTGGPTVTAEYRYDRSNGLNSPMQNLSYDVA